MTKAFTLVELLTVIVVLSVLVAIALPVFSYVRQSAAAVSCVSNLNQLGSGLHLYLNDHNGVFPTLVAARSSTNDNQAAIDNTLNAYIDNPKTFICPADYQNIGLDTGTSYYWNSALNGQMITSLNFLNITDLTAIPILADKEGFHPYTKSKVNILYGDGHVTKDFTFYTSP